MEYLIVLRCSVPMHSVWHAIDLPYAVEKLLEVAHVVKDRPLDLKSVAG